MSVRRVVAALVVAVTLGCSGPDDRPAPGGREFEAFPRSVGTGPDLSAVRLFPDVKELDEDRRVSAVVEIDRAAGMPELDLAAPTRDGPVDLAAILGEVGIDAVGRCHVLRSPDRLVRPGVPTSGR